MTVALAPRSRVVAALFAGLALAAFAPLARAQFQYPTWDPDGPLGTGGPPAVERIRITPGALDFGVLRLGEVAPELAFRVTNVSTQSLQLQDLLMLGAEAFEFVLTTDLPSGGRVLAPGQSADFGVTWTPTAQGPRGAVMKVDLGLGLSIPGEAMSCGGTVIGPLGAEILINAGGSDYTDQNGAVWCADFGSRAGLEAVSTVPVSGTEEQGLYQPRRQGLIGFDFSYGLRLRDAGTYEVTLHLVDERFNQPGWRLFDVLAEGRLVLDDFDLFAAAGGRDVAHQERFFVDVLDGRLDLSFLGVLRWPNLQGIEVRGAPFLVSDLAKLDFEAVASGDSLQLPLTLTNTGVAPATIDTVGLLVDSAGTPAAFSILLDGQNFLGTSTGATYSAAIDFDPGESKVALVTFAPTVEQYDSILLSFGGEFGLLNVPASGLGGHEGDPYLHVVITAPPVVVDYDGDGAEAVLMDGSASHTHEPGQGIVAWEWRENGVLVGTDPTLSLSASLGRHTLELTIYDDATPGRSLAGTWVLDAVTPAQVPGSYTRYYDATGTGASALLNAVPSTPDWVEARTDLVVPTGSQVGGSPFFQDVLVQLVADVDIDAPGAYQFFANGGVGSLLFLDGLPHSGPASLSTGTYTLEARFAVDSLADLPLSVTLSVNGGPAADIDFSVLTHDETAVAPSLNSMPDEGTTAGGNSVVIDGFGFFPAEAVVVDWGGTLLDFTQLASVSEPDQIVLISPPGSGTIDVTVVTPNGTSNALPYTYDDGGPVPIDFVNNRTYSGVPQPTAAVWGPDGHLYVAALDGRITELSFGDDWVLASMKTHTGVSALDNPDVLGIAISPFDPTSPVVLYVSHGQHFVNGGSSFSGPSPYTGQISALVGPSFDLPVPLITGLPTSNHDHGMNGIQFDDNGDLLIALGSNTNAGVKHPNSGDLPESPLSAAVLKARFSRPGFDGTITYADSLTGISNDDQVFGETVDQVGGLDVEVHALGLRNPFGLVYTTQRRLFATDNGPNIGFGAASTGADTETSDPYDVDELVRIEWDNYYGHPNRSRGRIDPRQNVYRNATSGDDDIPGEFTQTLTGLPSSCDGIVEYTADTFQGQLRGDLMIQQWNSKIHRVELDPAGRRTTGVSALETVAGLGLVQGYGGTLLSLDYSSSRVRLLEPVDPSATGLHVYDIYPWRSPATGGMQFRIGGVGFGTLANTSVTIGGLQATLLRVSSTRIDGLVPTNPTPSSALVDVVVTVDSSSDVHASAFRYLGPKGTALGTWDALPAVPVALGEVAAAEIDGLLYVVGEGSAQTFVFDLVNQVWLPNAPQRPIAGNHHSAEVVGEKLYLIGGLEGGAEGKLQIYDPATLTWSLGADMPWDGGSVASAVIGGKIYAAGGIVAAGYTVGNTAEYDPATDAWTSKTAMPERRNHAAASTDGQKLFVFGGRLGGNFVTNGYDDTQIYDPVTNTWQASSDGGSTLAPLPEARGGMGKAVYFRGEFYVFGGETLNDPDAVPGTGVYDRVDVYDPVANVWRAEESMPTPRHGLFPVLFQGRMFLPGGGTVAANAQSQVFDEFTRQ